MAGLEFSFKAAEVAFKAFERYGEALEKAATLAIRKTQADLKSELRSDVSEAGLGARLGNAWRDNPKPGGPKLVFPEKGYSLDAATVIWSKAPKIMRAFEYGATIRARNGAKYLAIPTENAPTRVGKGEKITPDLYRKYFGPLFSVVRNGKPIALVAGGIRQRKSGRFTPLTVRKASKTRGNHISLTGATTAIMFTLVPLARIKKRLHAEQVFRDAVRRLPGLILKYRRELLRA
ncbi:MAG: hypothetical protein E6R03_01190 [Hyphomicrobiaceae bacterium]|nr:MAG: hypothetical protein E6R03_01190 [Hyphomicrobiaceae bacterium]